MKRFLDRIRKKDSDISLKRKMINTVLITVLGMTLGFLSKWLDSRTFDNAILDLLDPGNFFSDMAVWLFIALSIAIYSSSPERAGINVFLFFLSMTVAYHLYTVLFSGFDPGKYMLIWYGLTAISPAFAYISWYAKSSSGFSIVIVSIIILVMLVSCFGIGMWYFDTKGILYTITFIASLLVLYKDIKMLSISFMIGLILSFMFRIAQS